MMANFIEELYYANIESQNMKTKMSFWKNFQKKIKSCFLNMWTHWVLLTENLLLIALLPDSGLEQSLHTILLYLLNRIY